MRGHRLIIEYNASIKADIKDGFKESFRCNTLERAQEIIKTRAKGLVKAAHFRPDSKSTIFQLV